LDGIHGDRQIEILQAGLPLLTRNRRHFDRIEGLSLQVLGK
jgi:predicted nucleic acid-binding protein